MKTKDWCFIHLTDPQFGMFRPGADDYDETPLVARAIERVNTLQPDFVLCSGDLVDVPGSDRQMDHARSMLADLDPDIPFLAVPGNHDVGDEPTGEILSWYRRTVGRDRFSFNHRGWHFIGIDSCLLAGGDAMPEETESQWAWLEDDLARPASARAAGRIAFMHHPPYIADEDEEADYFNLPRGSRARLLDLLRRRGVHALLCGHYHRHGDVSVQDPEIVVTGPVGMPLEEGYSGLRLVRVGTGGIEHRYFALDDVVGQEAFLNGGSA